ncbi:MAG: hypothetical protein LUC37_01855 [Prevotella sp.]|nr:hypothetical protein [Prevotella sp.]
MKKLIILSLIVCFLATILTQLVTDDVTNIVCSILSGLTLILSTFLIAYRETTRINKNNA